MENTQVQEKPQDEQLKLNIEVEEDEKDEGVEVKTEEAPEEPKEENNKKDQELNEYSGDVKKRIDTLTWKMREAERREKAALDFATKVKNCLLYTSPSPRD